MLPENHVLAGSPALERELNVLERVEDLPISGGNALSLSLAIAAEDLLIPMGGFLGAVAIMGMGLWMMGRKRGETPSPDNTSPQATNPPASEPSQPGAQPNLTPFIPEASYFSLGKPLRSTNNPSGPQLMTHFKTLFETSEKLGFTEVEVEMAYLLAGAAVKSQYCSVGHLKAMEMAMKDANDTRENVGELIKSGGWRQSLIFTPREKAILGYAQAVWDAQQTGDQAGLQRQKQTFRSELNDAHLEHVAHLVATGLAHAALAAHYNVIPPHTRGASEDAAGAGKITRGTP